MNIWIINEYAGSTHHGMEFRHYYLAKYFVKNGHKVEIITASYSHLRNRNPIVKKLLEKSSIDGIGYNWIKVMKYNHAHSKRRAIKWFEFALKFIHLHKKIHNHPKVILYSTMAPFLFPAVYLISKKYHAKLIFEVKDIWPLSLLEIGGYSVSNPFIRMMSLAENFAYKKSDAIVSVLPAFGDYLMEKNINKNFFWIPNGIDIDQEVNNKFHFINIYKKELPPAEFIVGYTGFMGKGDALNYLIDAARILNSKGYNIQFVLVGDGNEKENLKRMSENLSNVIFMDPVPKIHVQSLLKLFDVCYIGWLNKKIYKYGISANKIFDYMLAAKPILHAFSGKGDIVQMAKAGITVEAENPQAIVDGILRLYHMSPDERKTLGENGRKYVLENHTYEKLAQKYIEVFHEIEVKSQK